MKSYPSKTGPELVIPTTLVMGTAAILTAYEEAWPALGLVVAAGIFTADIFFNTGYHIKGRTLQIRCGMFFKKYIRVDDIRRLAETNNPLSSPATSLDRIEIVYGKTGRIMVSPQDKAGFIRYLVALKPDIEVLSKKKTGKAAPSR